jgi:hypothetical protein
MRMTEPPDAAAPACEIPLSGRGDGNQSAASGRGPAGLRCRLCGADDDIFVPCGTGPAGEPQVHCESCWKPPINRDNSITAITSIRAPRGDGEGR